MDNSINALIKKDIQEKKYKECNNILKKEITYYFVKKIQEKDSTFLYSTLVELVECSEIYLEPFEIELCKKFYMVQRKDYDSQELSKILIEIYEKIQ